MEWIGCCIAGIIFVFALVFVVFLGALVISIFSCFAGDFDFSLIKDFYHLICAFGEFMTGNETAGFFIGVLCLAAVGAIIGSFLHAFKD